MKNKKSLSKDLLAIENQIRQVIEPIRPSAAFVADLRQRLDQQMLKKSKTKRVKAGLLIAGGIVGIVVMIITLIRSLMSLPGVVKSIAKNFPRIKKREQAASA
jgi:hypothetical protein